MRLTRGAAPSCLLLVLALLPAPSVPASTGTVPVGPREAVRERLRSWLEHSSPDRPLVVGGEVVYSRTVLPEVYERRAYEPLWLDDRLDLQRIEQLAGALRAASLEGLEPHHYHLSSIESGIARGSSSPAPGAAALAELELLATDAFLIYGTHLLAGRVNPETWDPEWRATPRERDMAEVLSAALAGRDITAALRDLLPGHPGYAELKARLAAYRALARAGGWETVAPGPALRLGVEDPRVGPLRRRLEATGDLPGAQDDGSPPFDRNLEEAVRRFQRRHGLEPDGVVGPRTLQALNVSAAERARQIELNLERWRWLPQSLGERFILVNIPAFELAVVEGGAAALEMPVVVGRPHRRTPVFSDTMRYLVLNPAWEIPHSIAVKDQLPLIRSDPDYLARMQIRVYSGWEARSPEIDPAGIDWSSLGAGRFPYRLRQDPGPQNALGRVKFMFPNKFNIYLHDSPARALFDRSQRDFSSGCIRVARAPDLAEHLLRGQSGWNRQALDAAMDSGREQTVVLARPIRVHLQYWTAWADDRGTAHFRPDIYGRDATLEAALARPAP